MWDDLKLWSLGGVTQAYILPEDHSGTIPYEEAGGENRNVLSERHTFIYWKKKKKLDGQIFFILVDIYASKMFYNT